MPAKKPPNFSAHSDHASQDRQRNLAHLAISGVCGFEELRHALQTLARISVSAVARIEVGKALCAAIAESDRPRAACAVPRSGETFPRHLSWTHSARGARPAREQAGRYPSHQFADRSADVGAGDVQGFGNFVGRHGLGGRNRSAWIWATVRLMPQRVPISPQCRMYCRWMSVSVAMRLFLYKQNVQKYRADVNSRG